MIRLKDLLKEGPLSGKAKPTGLDNVTWGDGIVGNSKPSRDDINPALLDDVSKAAKAAGVDITITTAVSGHDPGTRHGDGDAVDIAVINGWGYSGEESAKKNGIYDDIMRFVGELEYLGYKKNSEGGNDKAVLTFGVPNHHHHVHVSRKSRDGGDSVSLLKYGGADGFLSYSDIGDEVRDMQQRLIAVNGPLAVGPMQDDGRFGSYTEKGVKKFQTDNQLESTGIYDSETQTKLLDLTKDLTPEQLSKITTKYIDSTTDLGNDEDFYKTILKGIDAPITNQNLLFFAAWRQAEGGKATNNPFNTTYNLTKDSNASNYNRVGVKNYSTPEYGIEATVKTLLLPYYRDLLQGLRDDIGASNLAAIDDELETWGTGELIAKVLNRSSDKITPPDIA
jgi:peptidoglycan hydrolase-like protein with peptidoglycan-binding domain